MIDPPWPASTRCLPNTWQPKNTPLRLTRTIRSNSSSAMSKNGVAELTPGAVDDDVHAAGALKDSAEQRFELALCWSLRRRETSRGRRPPRSCRAWPWPSPRFGRRCTTSAPAPASPSAIAPHSSPVPPMTTATLPESEKSELRKSADVEGGTRAVFYTVEYAARRHCEAIPQHRDRRRRLLHVWASPFRRYSDARRAPAPTLVESTATAKPEPPKPSIQYDREPLWAYGFETVAKADDKAPPQGRAYAQSAAERRSRRADAAAAGPRQPRELLARRCARRPQRDRLVPAGSSIADAANHQERPGRGHGQHRTRMRLVPSAQRERAAGERAAGRAAGRVLHAAASGLPQRPADDRPIRASRTRTR